MFHNSGAMYRNTRLPRLCSGVRPSVSLRLASILRYLPFSPAVLYHFKHFNWTSTPSRFMAHIRILGNLQFTAFQDGEGLPAYQFITDDSSTTKFPSVGLRSPRRRKSGQPYSDETSHRCHPSSIRLQIYFFRSRKYIVDEKYISMH